MVIRVGQLAPDFSLPSQNGDIVRLRDVIRDRFAVFAFYYFAFTGG
jgi:peroxiredoxin